MWKFALMVIFYFGFFVHSFFFCSNFPDAFCSAQNCVYPLVSCVFALFWLLFSPFRKKFKKNQPKIIIIRFHIGAVDSSAYVRSLSNTKKKLPVLNENFHYFFIKGFEIFFLLMLAGGFDNFRCCKNT